ncbi:hypothetical protein [Zestomonas thermotolerans]|uniref:hypothetical protein n=1 Tax=Zestomonas thermotolerans TaxID=157784 RepID=UPI00036D9FCB|nr:hypothetical protein [Pseudomonas thermotolerans]
MTSARQPEREPGREQQLLEHFRQHTRDEPSATLDARILAAARAACQAPGPSRWQRLKAWLAGGGRQPRWSLALAGVACLGIGLSLTWRTLQQVPPAGLDAPVEAMTYDAPAPQPRAKSAPPPEFQPRLAVPAAAPLRAEQALREAERSAAKVLAEPQRSLQRLLELRREGRAADAERLQERLRQDWPELDIEAELQRLERAR